MIKVLRDIEAARDGRDGRHRPRLRRPGARARAWACPPPRTASTASSGCPGFDDIEIVFDATSAGAHAQPQRGAAQPFQADHRPHARGHRPVRRSRRSTCDELADAAEREHGDLRRPGDDSDRRGDHAASRRCPTPRSSPPSPAGRPGPGTRANIDEFTETTARGHREASAARGRGKAIIVLNPAEPPLIMRDTVFCLVEGGRRRGDRARRSSRWWPTCRRTCPATA